MNIERNKTRRSLLINGSLVEYNKKGVYINKVLFLYVTICLLVLTMTKSHRMN